VTILAGAGAGSRNIARRRHVPSGSAFDHLGFLGIYDGAACVAVISQICAVNWFVHAVSQLPIHLTAYRHVKM